MVCDDVTIRGGVKDTRLEAKDTEKIRGQGRGQPFRGQTLSRPRTGMLDVKATDEELKRKCSPKKKVFKKFFFWQFQKKRSSQKFFRRCPEKKRFTKNFSGAHKIFTIKKIVLTSSRGHANFRGLEVSRPRT